MPDDGVKVNDGVALISLGNTIFALWNAPARLHRSQWIYDQLDAVAAQRPEGILCLLVLLPTANPPDSAARQENAVRLQKLEPVLRRLVTVVCGSELRHVVTRSVLRLMMAPVGSDRLTIANTVEEGMQQLRDCELPGTPSIAELDGALDRLCAALGVEGPPDFGNQSGQN